MDKIQKVLVEAGRKDLAQEYYEKTTKVRKTAAKVPAPFNEGDKVQVTEDIYQLSDLKLFDLLEELEKEEKGRTTDDPDLFSKSIKRIGTSFQ